ncbi:MAG: hypothetical protein ABEH90_03675 [Halolamina sp.]
MAGLPYFAFAWLVALVVVGGLVGIVTVTDAPGDDGNASGTTALATGLFVVALVASMTL